MASPVAQGEDQLAVQRLNRLPSAVAGKNAPATDGATGSAAGAGQDTFRRSRQPAGVTPAVASTAASNAEAAIAATKTSSPTASSGSPPPKRAKWDEILNESAPKTGIGKAAETVYAGGLGVGASWLGYQLSKLVMQTIKSMGPLTFKNFFHTQVVAGVGLGLPFAVVQDAYGYHNGEVTAKRYWGNVVSDALGWGVWGAAAFAVAGLLPAACAGWPAVAIGMVAGNVANSLFDHTLGRKVSNAVARSISPQQAKAGADFMDRWVAGPFDRYVVQPISRHPFVFASTAVWGLYRFIKQGLAGRKVAEVALHPGGATIAFSHINDGQVALRGMGAIAAGIAPQLLIEKKLNAARPLEPMPDIDQLPTADDDRVYQTSDGHVVTLDNWDHAGGWIKDQGKPRSCGSYQDKDGNWHIIWKRDNGQIINRQIKDPADDNGQADSKAGKNLKALKDSKVPASKRN